MAWGVPKLGTVVTDATGNFDLIEPVGVASGDLMIACIAMRGTAVVTPPTDWVAAATQRNTGDTDATDGIASGAMFYIVRGGSAPSLTFTRTAGDVAYGRIISYSGGSSTPLDTGSSETQAAAGATPTTPALVTAEDGELIVAMAAYGDQYTVSAFDAATDPTTASGATDTTTAPTNGSWIERSDSNTATGADTGLGIADAVKASAGSTGTIQATISSAAGRNYLAAAAFKLKHTFSQTETAFYEDGTEAGSTVISAGADSITRDVNSDSNIQLRVRLQETAASIGTSTDDYQLQYEKNDSGTYLNVGEGIADSYAESNRVASEDANIGNLNQGIAQSFTGDGGKLTKAVFYLKYNATGPTGSATAKIYTHSGTFGTSSVPTGAALATSANFDVSTLTTSMQLIDFTFSGAEQITLTSGTRYVVSMEYSQPGQNIQVAEDNTSPAHGGNSSYLSSGTWSADNTYDIVFYVYTKGLDVIGFNSGSLTDGNATTNRLGAGTGSFVAGEISEDGLVDNHQITASNYTEHLYSLTLVSAQLANNDTLDFRVLRNGATTGMTYTVTPRITVSKSGGGGNAYADWPTFQERGFRNWRFN